MDKNKPIRLIDANALKEEFIKWLPTEKDKIEQSPRDRQDVEDIAVSAIMTIEEAPTVSPWISVEDRLPTDTMKIDDSEFYKQVAVLTDDEDIPIKMGCYNAREGKWFSTCHPMYEEITVTHWMDILETAKYIMGR